MMQIGLFSNGNRNNTVAKLSYDEDLQEIVVADRLGMTEAWISEHGTFLHHQAPDQLPSADLLICKAAALTKQIKMGPGHPAAAVLPSAAGRDRRGGLRPSHRRALHRRLRRRHQRRQQHAARADAGRSARDVPRGGRPDPEGLERAGAVRLERPGLAGQEAGTSSRSRSPRSRSASPAAAPTRPSSSPPRRASCR